MQPPLLHTPGIGVLDSWLPALPPLSTPAAPVAATAAALPLLPFLLPSRFLRRYCCGCCSCSCCLLLLVGLAAWLPARCRALAAVSCLLLLSCHSVACVSFCASSCPVSL